MKVKGIFIKRCPLCNGKNLFIKRTFPELVYGCKDCEKKVKLLKEKGLSESDIRKIMY